MRDENEIQRAHDIFVGLILGHVPVAFDKDGEDGQLVLAVTDALCWVLKHDHNHNFQINLAHLEALIKDAGVELVDSGKLHEGIRPRPRPDLGFIGIMPCGCWAGWVSGTDEANSFAEDRLSIPGWLKDGYTVRPVNEGEVVRMVRCEEHKKA